MGATRDFVAATLADTLLPTFRRPVEDIIYETLDRRQVPTRTDFKEMRDLLNNIRGQVTGTANGVRKIVERSEDAEETLEQLEVRLAALEAENTRLQTQLAVLPALQSRLTQLEDRLETLLAAEPVDARIARAVEALRAALPAPPPPGLSPEDLELRLQAFRDDLLATLTPPAPAAAAVAEPTAEAPALEAVAATAEGEEAQEALPLVVVADSVAPPVEPCKVEGCAGEGRARGFCARHYQRWRRGAMKKTHVSLEGVVLLPSGPHRVDEQYAGDPYTVVGGEVLIGGQVIPMEAEGQT